MGVARRDVWFWSYLRGEIEIFLAFSGSEILAGELPCFAIKNGTLDCCEPSSSTY